MGSSINRMLPNARVEGGAAVDWAVVAPGSAAVIFKVRFFFLVLGFKGGNLNKEGEG